MKIKQKDIEILGSYQRGEIGKLQITVVVEAPRTGPSNLQKKSWNWKSEKDMRPSRPQQSNNQLRELAAI